MKIIRDENNNNLIISIPLKADIYNPYSDEVEGMMDNICGVIAGDEQGFAYFIDREYKGKGPDVSTIFLHYDKEDFKEKCKELGIEVIEYPVCYKCYKSIYGCHTMDKIGDMCMSCEDKV